MEARTVARRFVKPAIGAPAWQFLHDVEAGVRRARAQRAEREAAATAPGRSKPAPTSAALSDSEILARAKRIEADRKKRELADKSKDLTELAKHFRTDKWGNHFYTPHYQHHFAHLRDQPIRLLEIGIGGYSREKAGGASLRMWKHFFPKAQIVGLDIEDKSFVEEDRIKAYQGDQSDPELLARINEESGPFDIIIDDGSHRVFHVLPSFEILFPLLVDGGTYVIEDIQSSYWPEWGGSEDLNATTTSMALAKRLTDSLNYEEFVDDNYEPTYLDRNVVAVHFYHNMVFVEKGVNNEGSKRRQILKARYGTN